jgi:aryl-alcohol dehydrogenase-like predicted oxidoreductase
MAIGCSNFSAAELEAAERVSRERGLARFVSLQNHYSLLERGIEAEVAPACERLGVSILPFYPLAKGLLTGKFHRGEPAPAGTRLADAEQVGSEAEFDIVEALEAYAEQRGVGLLDVAIAGLAAQPAIGSPARPAPSRSPPTSAPSVGSRARRTSPSSTGSRRRRAPGSHRDRGRAFRPCRAGKSTTP